MKKEFRVLATVLVMGLSLTTLSMGGTAGCGSSAAGGGSVAAADEAAVEGEITSALSGIAGVASSGDEGALILRSEQVGLKAQEIDCTSDESSLNCDCTLGGSFSVDSDSIDFADCSLDSGQTIDGSVSFSESGDDVTVTFDNLSFSDDDCGDFNVDGTAVGTLLGDDTIDIALDVEISGDASLSLDCTINSEDTCPEIASACGLSSSDVCDGDDFAEFTCE